MDSREYQQRRQMLEEQLQSDLNLIRAGYEAKLRALETVWLTSTQAGGPHGMVETVETVAVETVAGERVPEKTVPASTLGQRDTLNGLLAALPALPKEFDKSDISRVLGYTPSRATLYRALAKLEKDGKIATVQESLGRRKTRYRAI
jgi:hypothetical protein